MSFRKQIILLIFLPLAVALLTGLLYGWGTMQIGERERDYNLSRDLVNAEIGLNFISDRYLIYDREDVFDEWSRLHRRMGDLLLHVRSETPDEEMLLADLAATHRKLAVIMTMIRGEARHQANAPHDRLMERLDEAAILKLRQEFSDSLQIQRINELQLRDMRRTIAALATAGVFAGVLTLTIVGVVTGLRIVASIQALRDGAEKIAAGDYATRVEVPMDHDLKALADSFNTMSEKVEKHSLYMEMSKKALEVEVQLCKKAEDAVRLENEIRIRAEESLRKLNDELEAKVKERTVEAVQAKDMMEMMKQHSDRQTYIVRRQSQMNVENQRRLEKVITRTRSLFTLGSVADAYQEIVTIAREAVNARFCVIGHGFREGRMSVAASARAPGAPSCPDTAAYAGERGGVYRDLLAKGIDVRLTEKELKSHPAWWGLPEKHIPLRGLIAVPVVGENQEVIGMLMVSDRLDGQEFDKDDEIVLLHLGSLASMALQCVMLKGCGNPMKP